MSDNGAGSATQTGATFTLADIEEMFASAEKARQADARAHDERMDAYGNGTIAEIAKSGNDTRAAIEKAGKTVLESVVRDGNETRAAIVACGKETRAAMVTSHNAQMGMLQRIYGKLNDGLSPWKILLSIAAGLIGGMLGYGAMSASTAIPSMIWLGVAGGALLFFAGGILIFGMIPSFGREETVIEQKPAEASKQEPKSEPAQQKPANKSESAQESKTESVQKKAEPEGSSTAQK